MTELKEKGVLNVLIDTWWNVNVHVSFRVSSVYIVLIDTWWNVNSEAYV